MQAIYIDTDYIKLDQLLKFVGIAENGSAAKYMILESNVKVNGEYCTRRGKKIYHGDIVEVDGFDPIQIKNR